MGSTCISSTTIGMGVLLRVLRLWMIVIFFIALGAIVSTIVDGTSTLGDGPSATLGVGMLEIIYVS